jgi:hypothetical protein
MKLKGKNLVVWIHDEPAKLFLGLTGQRPVSRWAVSGKCEDVEDIWLWMAIDHIHEIRPTQGKRSQNIRWEVKPRTCSLQWEWIITIQLGDTVLDVKEIGFTPRQAEQR